MRRPLRRRVEPRPDETAASLASRLAARNGTSLRRFCLDMQLSLHAVHDGRAIVGRAVAELAGHDPDAFAASMLTRLGNVESRDWSYRGQHLRTENLKRSCRNVCPLCLAEDLTAGGLRTVELVSARCVWRVRHLRTCSVHGVALIEVDEEVDKYSTYDNALVYRGLLPRLDQVCRDAVRRDPSDFEAYLFRRLETGVGGVAWLDRKPMWAASHLVERVGTAKLLGDAPNLNRLSTSDWWAVGRAGFEALEGGPEGIAPVLDLLHDSFRFTRTGRNAPRKIYGQLWRWIEDATGPEFDDVRDVMREHALSRLPLAAGTEVLGHVIERRRVHSLRSLHVETGRHQRRLRKMLAGHGLLPDGHEKVNPNRLVFDADRIKPLLAGIVAPMGTREVLDYLGVARVQPLIADGVITPIPTTGRKAGQHEFARADVEAVMEDLLRHAEPIDAVGTDQVDLVQVCKSTSRKMAEVITMVREGRLGKVWHRADANGLRSVIVSKVEVKALTAAPDHDALARHQVVKRMRVYHVAVQHLIEKKKLPSVVLPSSRGGQPATYVTEAALTAFQERYVTLSEMARTRRMSIRDVKRELVARGIEPVLSTREYVTGFYLRSDI